MPPDIEALLQRNEQLKAKKHHWFPLYQALAQFVMLRKQYFTADATEGPFLVNTVFDATAPHAAHMMTSSLLGQIWPNPFESFEFVPQIAQEDEVFSDSYDFMNTVGEVLPTNLAVAEAGVMTALHETFMDAVVFGTGALYPIDTGDFRVPIRAKSLDSKVMSFDENEAGTVDTTYMEKQFTVGKLVQRYGYKNVSEASRKLYDDRKLDAKVKVLHIIEPRRERNPLKLGTGDMPYASIHIEVGQKHLLQESGFVENPIIVVRFWKNVGEVQGRSPAMDALPDIRAVNKLVEMFEKTGEMILSPPKMISSEDVLGAGKPPWHPNAWIPIHASGRLGSDRKPIEPIVVSENPGWAKERIVDLRENIKQYFMLDTLTDLNNRSRQTLGEANIRNEKGMFITGPMLTRFLVELISPFLDRSFNILLENGHFGVIRGSEQDMRMQMYGVQPKYISEDFIRARTQGLKGYRLNFISPAARLMKLEELQGTQRLTEYAIALEQVDPAAKDNVNFDESLRAVQRLGGASQKTLYSPAYVERVRKARAQAQAEQQQMQAQMMEAAAFKDAAKGAKDIASAGQ